jgi:tetratricopeptide (TPR) repeat protein
MSSRRFYFFSVSVFVFLLVYWRSAAAFSTVVSDTDWAAWPEYCKVKYLTTPVGHRTRGSSASQEAIRKWARTLGEVWGGIHHYCVGEVRVHKAQATPNDQAKLPLFKQAVRDIEYSYVSLNDNSPIFSRVSAYYGMALNGVGRREAALVVLDKGIKNQPRVPDSYVAKAEVERKANRLDEAEQTLLAFLQNGGKATAEVSYYLGYIYLEKGDFENARRYTKDALANGYPLLGIKKRLEKLGEWR